MIDREDAARALILARLAASREELRRALDPPRKDSDAGNPTHGGHTGGFRSRQDAAVAHYCGTADETRIGIGRLNPQPNVMRA